MIKDPLLIAIGTRVKEIRGNMNLNQEEFADILNVDRTYICKIENGTQNLTAINLCKICERCNISIKEFFSSNIFSTYFFYDKEEIL